jgi:hypothetical protein
MMDSLAKVGNEPTFQTPEQFAATVRADLERWGPVVRNRASWPRIKGMFSEMDAGKQRT